MTPLVIGLTVVAFGTSAPELAVSVVDVYTGSGGNLAVGNAVGSNTLNVLLILGLSALVVPLNVQRQVVRLDRAGHVVWRLPYTTHHSVHQDDDGTLWVCAHKYHTESSPRFPCRVPPYEEYLLLQLTPDGKVVSEWSVADLLSENGYHGLLYLGTLHNRSMKIRGDALHLNDVEPFPERIYVVADRTR